MKPTILIRPMRSLALSLLLACSTFAQTASEIEHHVRAEVGFLASDELRGRGGATKDELLAAKYLATEMRLMGLAPAGDKTANGTSFIQAVPFEESSVTGASLSAGGKSWKMGEDFRAIRLTDVAFSGPIEQWVQGKKPAAGAIVYLPAAAAADKNRLRELVFGGTIAVLVGYGEQTKESFERAEISNIRLAEGPKGNVIALSAAMTDEIAKLPAGTRIQFSAEQKTDKRETRNVIGMIKGRTDDAIIISAHYDHVGYKPGEADPVYNGADDDASGVAAVLELARALADGPKPLRTVYFVLFGSEELGLIGGTYFEEHPPMPLHKVVAQLGFEMIGNPDPKVKPGELWFTGFDRSNLGPALAKHGAALQPDPHPEQHFFERSDNYALAKRGVIAHTVSSYGLHPRYHRADDDIAHIDFGHLSRAIHSMVAPVKWLVNSDFKPQWNPGKKP